MIFIVALDVIIPTVDISIDKARKILKGKGIISEGLLD